MRTSCLTKERKEIRLLERMLPIMSPLPVEVQELFSTLYLTRELSMPLRLAREASLTGVPHPDNRADAAVYHAAWMLIEYLLETRKQNLSVWVMPPYNMTLEALARARREIRKAQKV